MNQLPPYNILSLGDSALVVDFGNLINEEINDYVHALFLQLQNNPLPGMIEVVPAYSSLTIYYDVLFIRKSFTPHATAFGWMTETLKKVLDEGNSQVKGTGQLVSIPVCYEKEFGPDLEWMAEQNKISSEEVIQLHAASFYRVYMLGFLPGFAYMGMVDQRISSPRKLQPVTVEAGSVGIAGRQTGIYPLQSPGGWQIIGRTPLKLFDKDNDNPTLLKSGDRVQFYSITKDEFENIKSRIA